IKEIAIGGGVAANSGLREKLKTTAIEKGWTVHIPPFAFTTDNAAMIGIVGYLKYQQESYARLDQAATARLPI
ncbi:tRNA (adenosine(37)-N6)-threonylcarbamoyltransferase complex transferase subunit TsaD, partial [Flavobacteriaceae bacterium]|nr:tRNA (adenosine(37)-N6)-threonylcarbamoyltransferase complex transferase subunit TsaD [Flavobacteriaceae bacterium]